MKLSKKLKVSFILLALSTSCSIPNTSGEKNQNQFSVKSTINPDQIKKNFLNKTILKTNNILFADSKSFSFNVNNYDLKRKFSLNLINGLDTNNNVNRLFISVNGKVILKPFDIPDFDNKGSFKDIYQQVCREDKINKNNLSQCLKDILQGTFNKNTKNLSINLDNLKEGNNTIQIQLLGAKGSSLGVNIDGFMKPLDIPNAIFSNIPDTPEIRSYKHTPGRLGIKFLEGMKVRLINNPDGTQKLVDLNGTSLTQLERLMSQFGAKLIYRPIDAPPEMFDRDEIKAEEVFGTDVPNENLFYYINFPEDVNVWSLVDIVRQMPFIEEGFPDFIPTLASFCTNPTSANPNDCQLAERASFDQDNISVDKADWMKRIHVMPNDIDKGAWLYTKGKPEVKVASIDGAFQSSAVHPNFTTNDDFVDKENFEVIKNTNIEQEIINKPNFNDVYHNTSVSGIIGARGNNSKGVAGISYNSSLLSIVGINAGNSLCKGSQLLGSKTGQCQAIEDSILLATLKGAKVISISVGSNATPEQLYPALRAEIARAVALGTVVVIATGNGSPSGGSDLTGIVPLGKNLKTGIEETGLIPDTGSIVVGGLRHDPKKLMDAIDNHTVYDNGFPYGVSKGRSSSNGTQNLFTEGGHATDVSGPVRYIWTTYPHSDSTTLPAKFVDYGFFGGVSAAVPMVASTAALMLSENPNLTPFEVRKILRETRGQTTGKPIAGMLNAYKAVQEARKNKVLSLGDYKEIIGKVFGYFLAEENNMIKGDNRLLYYKSGNIGVNLATSLNKEDVLSIDAGGLNTNIKNVYGSLVIFDIIMSKYLPTSKDLTIQTTKGDLTIKNAIDIQSKSIAIGLKPIQPVNFPDGTSLSPDKFIDNNSKLSVKTGDTVGVAIRGDLANITISLGGKSATLQSIVDDYISFKIPPDIASGAQDVIIGYAGGNITFKDALEVLATNPNIAKNNKIAISGYKSYDSQPRSQIFTLNPNGTEVTQVSSVYGYSISWSPDKSKIAYGGLDNSNDFNLYVMNADGSNKTQISNNNSFDDDYPIWSNDGQRIAYISYNSDGTSSLCVVNPDGSNFNELVRYPRRIYINEKEISWSYDGSKIAYNIDDNIYILDVNSKNIIKVTNSNSSRFPDWTIDNKLIYRDSYSKIIKVNSDGTSPTEIYSSDVDIQYLSTSLNGAKIAFAENRFFIENNSFKYNSDLYTINLDGSNKINATNNLASDYSNTINEFSWSVDGSAILYKTRNSDINKNELWTVNINSSNKSKLDINFDKPFYSKWSTKSIKDKDKKQPRISW